MKIGVLSDTHVHHNADKIPDKVFDLFSDVDLILHAGDIVNRTLIDDLESIAKVEVVKGNMDGADMPYPIKKTLNIEQLKLGLIHGYGPKYNIRERIRKEFNELDIIVYGHSHKAFNKIEHGILFFNPGSPTDKSFAEFNSVGLLEVKEKEAKGKIIKL